MFATLVQCEMRGVNSPQTRGRRGRALATALSALPGFVAFLAFDSAAEAVTALCLFDDQQRMADAQCVIARWQHDDRDAGETTLRYLSAGDVLVQKGF